MVATSIVRGAKVLVINSGSSSLKFKLFGQGQGSAASALGVLASGLVERIGDKESSMHYEVMDSPKATRDEAIPDHTIALTKVIEVLRSKFSSSIADEMKAVGHRVVHGGPFFTEATVVQPEVLKAIRQVSSLAPLHNPPNLMGIEAASQVFTCPQVVVFDTAFHMTMAPSAFMYALPYHVFEDLKIRRYGFHGTSYKYVTAKTAQMLGKRPEDVNLIVCHLGAGSSMCCVRGGKSVDTTMGVTPLEGLVMASRCGDVDPAAVLYLLNHLKKTPDEVDSLLNKSSGLLGVCGQKDFRSILEAMAKGDARAQLAHDLFVRRVRKYLGAYLVELGGQADAVVFTAGIGENAASVRGAIVDGLQGLGILADAAKNKALVGGKSGEFQAQGSKVKLMIVPTDEELSIAQQSLLAIDQQAKA